MFRLFFFIIFPFSSISTALLASAVAQEASPIQQGSAKKKLRGGIRFVVKMKDTQARNVTPYLMISDKKFVPISLQSSIPGDWNTIPKDRALKIYDCDPTLSKTAGSKITQKPVLLYSGNIPTGFGNKILGLVTVLNTGKLDIEFFDESRLTPGIVYFKNLTRKKLLLQFPNAPVSEKKEVEISPGQEHTFGSSFAPTQTASYKAALFHQAEIKNAGIRWIPIVQFSVVRYQKRAIITFLLEDMETKRVMFNKIMVYCDR